MSDLISRQAAIDALRTCYDTEAVTYTNGNEYISYDQALDLIGELPSAEPEKRTNKRTETHECDYISRQDAIEALTHEWDGMVTSVFDVVKALPSAQPETHEKRTETHSCDLISRQDVLKIIRNHIKETDSEYVKSVLVNLAECVKDTRSAEPEIVRCKDCKHQVKEWRTDKRLKDNGYMVCGCDVVGDACGYWALLGQDDDYCSMAERRTDG